MSALLALADDLAADRRMSPEEALRVRKEIFPDGVVSRQEAEVLIALHGRVDQVDTDWTRCFVEALTDHALQSGRHPGHVEDQMAQWLIARFGVEAPRAAELEALLKICELAESTPQSLQAFARERVAAFVHGRAIGAADVEYIRRCLYAGTAVTDAEIRWMFDIDAATDGYEHDPAWRDLFVKAGVAHVEGRQSPAVLDADAMLARETRFAARAPVTPMSVLQSIFKGGLAGYASRTQEPGWVEGMEERYEAANAETEADAHFTAAEAARMLGLADGDGKRTANEAALLQALEELEARQAPWT
jgi:hypothetical protein